MAAKNNTYRIKWYEEDQVPHEVCQTMVADVASNGDGIDEVEDAQYHSSSDESSESDFDPDEWLHIMCMCYIQRNNKGYAKIM